VTPKRILHCHSTFSLGGKEARAVRLMNAFGAAAEHTILSSVPDALGAREALDPRISVAFPGAAAPLLYGRPGIARYRTLSSYMGGFDLVLTYNWGAMDAVGARRLFPKGCPPLIHHEDGFNADEAKQLNWKRNAFRRLMLPAAKMLVTPSRTLETIACKVWKQPTDRLIRIFNGIDTSFYSSSPEPASIPGLIRQPGDVIVGTLAGLRPVKNLSRLVRAVATLPSHVKLVIVGEGPERDAIRAEAARTRMIDRLILPGFLPQPHRYMGHFDVFALSSDSEQFPISLVEAMAASLPVAATDVGDVRMMVAEEGRAFVVPPNDEVGLTNALFQLASDANLRNFLGGRNRDLAVSEYDEKAMIEQYATIYAIGSN
jgi:L-malate glycosyltransferase